METQSPTMVSPYLLRPIRSLEEAISARHRLRQFDAVAIRALTEANTAGESPDGQFKRAVAAIIRLRPDIKVAEAAALVERVKTRL